MSSLIHGLGILKVYHLVVLLQLLDQPLSWLYQSQFSSATPVPWVGQQILHGTIRFVSKVYSYNIGQLTYLLFHWGFLRVISEERLQGSLMNWLQVSEVGTVCMPNCLKSRSHSTYNHQLVLLEFLGLSDFCCGAHYKLLIAGNISLVFCHLLSVCFCLWVYAWASPEEEICVLLLLLVFFLDLIEQALNVLVKGRVCKFHDKIFNDRPDLLLVAFQSNMGFLLVREKDNFVEEICHLSFNEEGLQLINAICCFKYNEPILCLAESLHFVPEFPWKFVEGFKEEELVVRTGGYSFERSLKESLGIINSWNGSINSSLLIEVYHP